MSIVRTYHNKENPYVMLSKASLWDEKLSLRAVGLWARLMSRPDDWKFRTTELAKNCDLNRDTINKILNELIDKGYGYRYQTRLSNGKVGPWEIIIFEEKKTKEEIQIILQQFQIILPERKKPEPVNSVRTNTSSKEEVEKKKQASKGKTKIAAAPSIEDQIKKSRIPKEERAAALAFYKANPRKFEGATNGIGLLITIVDAGEHRTPKSEEKEFIDKLKERFSRHPEISFRETEVCFYTGLNGSSTCIKYKDPSMKERVIDFLKRMKLDVSDLK